jgi:hypothetical protein
VAWRVQPESHDVAVARGLARQWALLAKEAMPPVLELVAAVPSWLAAMIRARALAGDDARANALLDGVDHEIARITGHAAPRWPARLSRAKAREDRCGPVALPMLDPGQHLVCTGALARETPATVAAMSVLLGAAFAEPPANTLASDLRVRAVAVGLPEPFRTQWLRGSGLTPPDDVVPGAHRAALGVLRRAYVDAVRDPSRVGEVELGELARPIAALDVVLATATVRACLRAAGELEAVAPAELAPVVAFVAPAARMPEPPRARAA